VLVEGIDMRKENCNEGGHSNMECYTHGKRITSVGEKESDHERKGKIREGSVRVMENETEENRDMFDENNEGYKGRTNRS
jgi:hypothetical protein